MSSRLGLDARGRTVVIVTTRSQTLDVGHVFVVVDGRLFGLLPERARPPTPRERGEARAPYNATHSRSERQREKVPDELLAEEAAIRLARLEQQREPADLLRAA